MVNRCVNGLLRHGETAGPGPAVKMLGFGSAPGMAARGSGQRGRPRWLPTAIGEVDAGMDDARTDDAGTPPSCVGAEHGGCCFSPHPANVLSTVWCIHDAAAEVPTSLTRGRLTLQVTRFPSRARGMCN